MSLLGPFSVGYPVAFRSGGDTTREAFGKHIQEIERIYGILNALDAGKLSSGDMAGSLDAHIQSTNPHPNWKPNISFSDLSGSIDASKISGSLANATIPAGNVIGNLTQATIDYSKVNGLQNFVNGLITAAGVGSGGGSGDGIIMSNLSKKGYAKFNNGLIANWNSTTAEKMTVDSGGLKETFAQPFSSSCFCLVSNVLLLYTSLTTTSFVMPANNTAGLNISYIALGI